MALKESHVGPFATQTAHSLVNLAKLLGAEREFARAEAHFSRALKMFEANLGKERVAQMDFAIQFPESLEDWIEAAE